MTSESDLYADEQVVADQEIRETFAGGATSATRKIAGLTVDLAGDVTVGVASSAELAEVITVGVASSTDLAGVVTAGVAPSADPDGDVTTGVTYMVDYGDVLHSGVASLQTDPDGSFTELETIVVGVVGMGAPWFLTGWAEWTEVEFMIDTGCQVTILS